MTTIDELQHLVLLGGDGGGILTARVCMNSVAVTGALELMR